MKKICVGFSVIINFRRQIILSGIWAYNGRMWKMKLRERLRKSLAVVLSAAFAGVFGTAGYYSRILPETVTAEAVSGLKIAEYPEIKCCGSPFAAAEAVSSEGRVTLSLFGAIPVKSVEVHERPAPVLVAGGSPFGIKLIMEGVMVTELGGIDSESGEIAYPAKNAGIKVGDVIHLANGQTVTSNSHLQEIIGGSGGKPVTLSVSRDDSSFTAEIVPVKSKSSGKWRGGMWVRDSIAGIGTMTFVDKETGQFAGLGHPICDADTGELVPIQKGEAVPVEINEAKKGVKGVPGELGGRFIDGETYGTLCINNECGIFGRLSDEALSELCSRGIEYKMGFRQDITTGNAEILATVSGESPERYAVEIESVDYSSKSPNKNMVIRITDPRLIDETGGIVQGMSGSPIIQNGRLIGAVTHVFVADPTRGYGIFAENMVDSLEDY